MRIIYGCSNFLPQKIQYALGQADAGFIWLKSVFGYTNLRDELED
jgi:hypothetical protein